MYFEGKTFRVASNVSPKCVRMIEAAGGNILASQGPEKANFMVLQAKRATSSVIIPHSQVERIITDSYIKDCHRKGCLLALNKPYHFPRSRKSNRQWDSVYQANEDRAMFFKRLYDDLKNHESKVKFSRAMFDFLKRDHNGEDLGDSDNYDNYEEDEDAANTV